MREAAWAIVGVGEEIDRQVLNDSISVGPQVGYERGFGSFPLVVVRRQQGSQQGIHECVVLLALGPRGPN